ncbi:MAG: DNA polymerase III subunit delta' [Maricaulaceae bacterium]|nr:DNA polymerase III subunit delta' [Maricaulaceae bacterium]
MSGDIEREPDAQPGCPHPRDSYALFGHEAAETAFLSALEAGKLHHAWLLTGPRGVGKASFAYRAARRLLGAAADPAHGPLGALPDDPVCRRIAAQAHSGLLVLRRPWDDKRGRWRAEITVEEARRAPEFFAMSAGEGGWRVCIVDAIDDMNRNAVNALLKTLEEPPHKGMLFLVAHAPGRLPATIRSRCRVLSLRAPEVERTAAWLSDAADITPSEAGAAARLAQGAPGRALALARAGVAELASAIDALFADLPRFDETAARRLAARVGGRDGESLRGPFYELLAARMAEAGKQAAGQDADGGGWAQAWRDLHALVREAEDLYLDPKQTALSALSLIRTAARAAEDA